jgi:hypothetical protein
MCTACITLEPWAAVHEAARVQGRPVCTAQSSDAAVVSSICELSTPGTHTTSGVLIDVLDNTSAHQLV